MYKLTRKRLILDLHAAFQKAKIHKGNKPYVIRFERDLKKNIEALADELLGHTYKPSVSSCFIIERPKKREVFAATFRDRIVHHLYFNYTHEMFERTFIQDSYSCIAERGTHYGVQRLAKHIRQESVNYTRQCFVLKLDIRGYFMHINRERLAALSEATIINMSKHNVSKRSTQMWEDIVDIDFVLWLTRKITLLDPTTNYRLACDKSDWIGLDYNKSLFNTDKGLGLPIGNLTSQLLSNVYLNVYDQYMKRELKCKHYGRYVDDSYVVSSNKEWLLSIIPKVRGFLKENLGLDLHMGKLLLTNVRNGVEFLGAFVKPYRMYVSNSSIRRMLVGIRGFDYENKEKVWQSINSYLGILSHYATYNIRCNLFLTPSLMKISTYNNDMTKMIIPT